MDPYSRLEKRILTLGNHYQKYLHTIHRFLDCLLTSLRQHGRQSDIRLWNFSSTPDQEMKIIHDLPTDTNTRIKNISCYYALQYLHMIFCNLDELELGLCSPEPDHTRFYNNFMVRIGTDFRKLSKAYIRTLIDIYLPEPDRPEFFICSVGTRADQDDIDIGLISSEKADQELLNQAFQKITQNMLVYATPLHLYLSEHVGSPHYTTTISEYKTLLRKQIHDVVIISELINATFLCGSESLYEQFQQQVVSKYFFIPETDIRYHEGFLRGILGEVRAILITPPGRDALSPKEDILRLIKLIIYAKRSIYNLHTAYAWDNLVELKSIEPHLQSEYQSLTEAMAFLELFKFLLQLYIVQEDSFRLHEIDPAQLSLVADRMGYRSIGIQSGWDQLINDYYRYVREIRKTSTMLLDDLSKHLNSISSISTFLKSTRNRQQVEQQKKSLAGELFQKIRFFTGTKYWDDILDLLETDPELLDSFIDEMESLPDSRRNAVIQQFAGWSRYTLITMIRLVTITGKKMNKPASNSIYDQFCQAFLQLLTQLPHSAERLCRIFYYYPRHFHAFLERLPEEYFSFLETILDQAVYNENLQVYQQQLIQICRIYKQCGPYFHHLFKRVISLHPQYLHYLTQPEEMYSIAGGYLSSIRFEADPEQNKKLLGDYYDLEFVRIGLATLRGEDLRTINSDFTEFCDSYLRELFQVCKKEIVRTFSLTENSIPDLALMVTGGHGRMEAYDDDYDLIMITDTPDQEKLKIATALATRMNREIVKRGLLPHYRLGEILGSYVSTLDQIKTYFSANPASVFIDLSQFLGARIIVGSDSIRKKIDQEILDTFIFKKKKPYIRLMIQEIYQRQNITLDSLDISCNLKESQGGLRDIEAIALILKAFSGYREPVSDKFFSDVKNLFRELHDELEILSESVYVLRHYRNLYHLLVSTDDRVQTEQLSRLIPILHQSGDHGPGTAGQIMDRIQSALARSAVAGAFIANFLTNEINKD